MYTSTAMVYTISFLIVIILTEGIVELRQWNVAIFGDIIKCKKICQAAKARELVQVIAVLNIVYLPFSKDLIAISVIVVEHDVGYELTFWKMDKQIQVIR